MQNKIFTSIGMMSGTSCDGIDVALIETDGEKIYKFGESIYLEYSAIFKEKLKYVMELVKSFEDDYLIGKSEEILILEQELTELHIKAVQELLLKINLKAENIDLIGFHGQTIIHKPKDNFTLQIGNGQILANETEINVICNFRENDIKFGGQGAPLVPMYHQAIMQNIEKPVSVINIGGVSNITYLRSKGEVIAFDTGPGSAYIDDFMMKHHDKSYDENGKYARGGKINLQALNELMNLEYLKKKPPKSLDRNEFKQALCKLEALDLSVNDHVATLTAFTAKAIAESIKYFSEAPNKLIATGGGRKNTYMMELIAQYAKIEIVNIDNIGIQGLNGDNLEASAFAYLAVRSKLNLPISIPSTTGVRRPTQGGVFYKSNF